MMSSNQFDLFENYCSYIAGHREFVGLEVYDSKKLVLHNGCKTTVISETLNNDQQMMVMRM